jgi:molybdopterin/thiamine biosynthesis adenylyltransferase
MFLKDETDKILLKPRAQLYGILAESTGLIFMTPYKPPAASLPWIGIFQNKPGEENEQPLLINVSNNNNRLTAKGFIHNKRFELPVEVVYAANLYERTPFNKIEMDILWNAHVVIFGGGTGGSKIAAELVRGGVGKITICDPDRLEYANVSRHEGDLLDVGKPKTQLVAERIYKINPAIHIEAYPENIFERPLNQVEEIFRGKDLVVAATDKTAVQLQVNEFAHRLNIPAVFGGCYEEARGGEVLFTLPEKNRPCLACLRSGLKQPLTNRNIDYSTAASSEDYKGEPGLHAAIDFITSVEILVCMGILLRKIETSQLSKFIMNSPSNFILIGGALALDFYRFRKPFDIFFQPLSGPRKNCPVCGNYDAALKEESDPYPVTSTD